MCERLFRSGSYFTLIWNNMCASIRVRTFSYPAVCPFQGYRGPTGPVGPPGMDGDKVRWRCTTVHLFTEVDQHSFSFSCTVKLICVVPVFSCLEKCKEGIESFVLFLFFTFWFLGKPETCMLYCNQMLAVLQKFLTSGDISDIHKEFSKLEFMFLFVCFVFCCCPRTEAFTQVSLSLACLTASSHDILTCTENVTFDWAGCVMTK